MAAQTLPTITTPQPKKKLIRRLGIDRSQRVRHLVQGAFVVLNAWLGLEFYLWVRYFECGGTGLYVARPAGVEGWLPIAGLMNAKYFFATGQVPAVHPAAMFPVWTGVLTAEQRAVAHMGIPDSPVVSGLLLALQGAVFTPAGEAWTTDMSSLYVP